jgi:3',5'-cyclic AMP phosphodiesterase CpdA
MILVQLSDTHVVAPPGAGAVQGVDTAAALARALDAVEALKPRADHVLITGDLVDKRTPLEYAALASVLKRVTAPLWLVPGNHDDRTALAEAFPHLGYLRSPEGFIQYTADLGPCRLIAADTTIPKRHDAALDTARLQWLERALADSAERPVILALHHPPFATGLAAFDALPFEGRERLEALVARFPNVERIVCGHNHRPIQCRFGGAALSVCPSTAFSYALHFEPHQGFRLSPEPPGFLVHIWNHGRLVTHTVSLPMPSP